MVNRGKFKIKEERKAFKKGEKNVRDHYILAGLFRSFLLVFLLSYLGWLMEGSPPHYPGPTFPGKAAALPKAACCPVRLAAAGGRGQGGFGCGSCLPRQRCWARRR